MQIGGALSRRKLFEPKEEMSMVVGLALTAAGAILLWAVDYEASWIDLDLVGIIVGIVGLVALIGSAAVARRRTAVEERAF